VQVLGRKRAPLAFVAEALRERGIAHVAPEQRELVAAPEVRDLLALLDALASPAHALSLAQALRSPLFGADDDDLAALALAARAEGGWWSALRRGAGPGRPALERARALLPRWAEAARALPPHDLLDRILAEGEVRECYAAALPDADRARGLAAIDALLGESLRLDGGRYATPYNFVRALRRRRVLLPPASAPDAVQLLTIHGAKGLEARAVFVVDGQSEAPRAHSATLLIDWPADAVDPRRCAFIASEARCPPSLRGLMDEERAGRAREELNGLYVAMTRARERLLFSATEPYGAAPGPSAWQRLADAGVPRRDPPPPAASGAAEPAAITLQALPPLPADALPRPAPALAADAAAGEAARLGRAVHRVLERLADAPPLAPGGSGRAPPDRTATPTVAPPSTARRRSVPAGQLGLFDEGETPGADGPVDGERAATVAGAATDRPVLDAEAARAAAEFGLPAEAGARIAALAGAVLRSPACRRFFDGERLLWAGNEVPLAWRGATLRIDRLVALRGAGGAREWWVLDYKLEHAPQQVEAYRGQLAGYRDAVQRLQPGETVRAAFVTGAGEIVPL
jgi:ATP-dependent helicase/nuclease subunit A